MEFFSFGCWRFEHIGIAISSRDELLGKLYPLTLIEFVLGDFHDGVDLATQELDPLLHFVSHHHVGHEAQKLLQVLPLEEVEFGGGRLDDSCEVAVFESAVAEELVSLVWRVLKVVIPFSFDELLLQDC